MIEVYVDGIGLVGTGLQSWEAAQPILRGAQDFVPVPPSLPTADILAPNERRRAGTVVRLAIAAAQAATKMAALPSDTLRGVFASANGEGSVIHAILEAVTTTERHVSPTQFHNSVHNAPAGYWSIGVRSLQSMNSLGCHDASAPASFLKAAAEVKVEKAPVLLCIYDAPLPEPLSHVRPIEGLFSAALVLTPSRRVGSYAALRLNWRPGFAPDGNGMCIQSGLQKLYSGNPAARLLPVLMALARKKAGVLTMSMLDGHVEVDVEPCLTASKFSS